PAQVGGLVLAALPVLVHMRLPHSDYVNRATLPTHDHTVTALHGSDPLNTPNILTTSEERTDTNAQVRHGVAAQGRRNFGLAAAGCSRTGRRVRGRPVIRRTWP